MLLSSYGSIFFLSLACAIFCVIDPVHNHLRLLRKNTTSYSDCQKHLSRHIHSPHSNAKAETLVPGICPAPGLHMTPKTAAIGSAPPPLLPELVTQAEKWPDRAPTTTRLCCRTKMVPSSSMGNQPPKQMALSESRIEIRSVHRNISV